MRTFGKWLGRILLMLILAIAVVYVWKRDQVNRLYSVVTLYDANKIVGNFSGMNLAFPNTEIDRGTGPVHALAQGPSATMPDAFDTWVTDRTVTSLVVLKDGALVHESYYQGTTDTDRRMSFSVAKSFLSALFGVVVSDGQITSLDDPVTKYAASLKGSAYDGASIKNVLQMSSGVLFDEDYLAFSSDINRMSRVLALGGSMDGFTEDLRATFTTPGAQWKYVSIDTHVLSMVIRGATGRDIAALMSEKIIAPLGLEQAPYYITDGDGVAFVLGGLNLRTRDYARFGQMFLQNGMLDGHQIVPADWVTASTQASAKTAPGKIGYGYQWWIPVDATAGEFLGRGIYGQYIYVNQPLGIVIASTAADRLFRESGVHSANIAMFRAIAASAQ
ncbi:serine hydrolase [Shimia sp.]|uniref:serine hydrolase domain-containing protein n=1 Tax=Shimia sp. TaxID=1954381 RepID=UPI0032983956